MSEYEAKQTSSHFAQLQGDRIWIFGLYNGFVDCRELSKEWIDRAGYWVIDIAWSSSNRDIERNWLEG